MNKHTNISVPAEIVIGKDVLELVSSAMYVDPLTIYREYNAIDEGGHRFMLLRETAKSGQDLVLADVHRLIERFNRRRSTSPTSLMYSRILVEDE